MKFFGLKVQCRAVRDFFNNLVRKTVEEREKNKTVRKDLMQYLIQLRNNISEKADGDNEWNIVSTGELS